MDRSRLYQNLNHLKKVEKREAKVEKVIRVVKKAVKKVAEKVVKEGQSVGLMFFL